MYKQKSALILLMFLFCVNSIAFSQISVVPSSGCMPNGITNAQFSYTGSGTPTNIVWNFGDGSPTNNLPAAQHSYPNIGTYTVSYSATIGGSNVTYTYLVVVNPVPTGNFSFTQPSSHCLPMTVNFSGTSTQNNLVYNWVFGDLGGGSGSTASHIYNSPGSYTPGVTIQNTLTGCFLNLTGNVIHVSALPTFVINPNPGYSSCSPSFITALDAGNSVSGSPISGGGLTYNWNLGQFGSSTQANTGNIVFTPVGVYVVTLTATDNNNCSASTTRTVSLVSPTLNVTVPSTFCVNQQVPPWLYQSPYFAVTVQSSEPTTLWNMDDGFITQFPLPATPPAITPILSPNVPYTGLIHTYMVPGLKTITVTATAGPCVATVTKTIFVEQVTPAFVSTPPSHTCSPTVTVGYINQSTVNSNSSLTYTWALNNWGGAYLDSLHVTNPTFTMTQGSLNPYVNYGHPPYFGFPSLLVVSQPNQCWARLIKPYDTIQRPAAIFEVTNQSEGCVPLSVTFTNVSQTHTLYPITSYTWNFGASPSSTLSGTSTNTATPIPPATFNYTAPGVYYPTLTIATASGCGSTSYQHTITVVTPPLISYTMPVSPICAGQAVQANFTSTPSAQHWNLQGDNGYFSGCVSDPNPIWNLNHPGTQSFTLSAYLNGCKSTVVTPPVTINGPIGKMRFETNCSINSKSVKFNYELEDVETAVLDFGDGSPTLTITGTPNSVVTGVTLPHIYTNSGNYIATLTSINNGNSCPAYTYTVLVSVRSLVADFIFGDSIICKTNRDYPVTTLPTLTLNAQSSTDVMQNSGTSYAWYIDNLPPRQIGSPIFVSTDTFNVVGMHTVKLVVKDTNGCKASITKNFRVSSPAPNFTFNANPICLSSMLGGSPLQLIDLTPQAPDSVFNYTWTMGDSALYNQIFHSTISGTVSNHSPTFVYPTIGGLQTRTFTVTLYVTNSEGCSNYTRKVLTVNDPVINVVADKYFGCAPQLRTFSFTASTTHTNYNVYYGEGTASNITTFTTNSIYTSNHAYASPGTYTPVFTVTDFGGCSNTLTLTPIVIQLKPVASFTFVDINTGIENKLEYCATTNMSVTSTSQSSYALGYDWVVGNLSGYTSSNTASNIFPTTGQYTISLVARTIPAGCWDSVGVKVNVFVPVIDFKIVPDSTKTIYCLGSPISVSVTTRQSVPGFQWDFGDGVPTTTILSTIYHLSTYSNTFFPLNSNGELTVTLTGYSGATGIDCKDKKSKVFYIKRVESDFLRNEELSAKDSIHCLGALEVFKDQSTTNAPSGLNYTWLLGDGTVKTSTNVSHTYTASGTYFVKLRGLDPVYGCKDSVTKKMIIYPLPNASMVIDTFSCPGDPFTIKGSGNPGVSGVLTGTVYPGPVAANFTSGNTFSTSSSASVSTTYTLKVTDNNGCENAAKTSSIFIQQPAPTVHWDTTVIIGSSIPLNAYAGSGFTYTWAIGASPYLDCDTCLFYNPVSTTTVNYTYSVSVEDGYQCSVVANTYRVNIDIRASLDVPTAFTPNGDGVNDFIYPGGWGIRKLNYFKIFNRWGQLIFESNDLKVGWDGVFQGVPQNIETYVYQASVETFDKEQPVLTKTGTFKLLR